MNNVFEWKNIYSIKNAAIIEMLLDRKVVPFDEIVCIFGIDTKFDNEIYLINLISPWHSTATLISSILPFKILISFLVQEYLCFQLCMALCHDLALLKHYYIPNLGENQRSVVISDKILSLMISKKILPTEICRLPRLKNEPSCINIIPDYYEDHLDYNSAANHEIVFYCKNYCSTEPLTLTYSEAIKRMTKYGHPESLLKIHAKNKSVGVYIQVAEESILTDDQMKRTSTQSIAYFLNANSGNPSYKKRYKGLERLALADVNALFNGKSIFIKDYDIRNSLAVQATDIETKYHLQRYIKLCITNDSNGQKNESNKFQLKDSVYIEEDIGAIILYEEQINVVNDDQIYNFKINTEEIKSLIKELGNDPHSKERIKKNVLNHKKRLEEKYPHCNKISKARVSQKLKELEKPIYDELGITQPKDYERYTRN